MPSISFFAEPPMDPEPQYAESDLNHGKPHLHEYCEDCGTVTPFADFYDEWDPAGLVACIVCRRCLEKS